MKRRNFLSGLLAAPLALKAKLPLLAGFFAPKPSVRQLTLKQLELARQMAVLLATNDDPCLRRGRKLKHYLLNLR